MTNWNSLDGMWDGAEADFEKVPDGTYHVRVDRVELKTSQAGNQYLNWQLRIQSGPHEGQCLFKKNMLMNKDNLAWLKKDLSVLGITLDRPSDLEKSSVLEQFLDLWVEVRKVTKGDFDNVYFQKRIVTRDSARPGEVVTENRFDDDDIPF